MILFYHKKQKKTVMNSPFSQKLVQEIVKSNAPGITRISGAFFVVMEITDFTGGHDYLL